MNFRRLKLGSFRRIRTCLTLLAVSSTACLALLFTLISSHITMFSVTDHNYVQWQKGQRSLLGQWMKANEDICPHATRPAPKQVLWRNKYWQYAKREQSSEELMAAMTGGISQEGNTNTSKTETANIVQDSFANTRDNKMVHNTASDVLNRRPYEDKSPSQTADSEGQRIEQSRLQNEGEIVVYSAFYDSRSLGGDIHSIRILGLLSNRTAWDIYCHVWYPGYDAPYVTQAFYHVTGRANGYRLGMPSTDITHVQVQFTCSLDSTLSNQNFLPSHVSLVTSRCARATIFLPVQTGSRRPRGLNNTEETLLRSFKTQQNQSEINQFGRSNFNPNSDNNETVLKWLNKFAQRSSNYWQNSDDRLLVDKYYKSSEAKIIEPVEGENWRMDKMMNFIVCVPISFGHMDTAEFVEWIEFYKLMGVSEIHIYDSDIKNMTSVFDYYQSIGLLHLHPIPPPIDPSSGTRKKSTDPIKVASAVGLNDCMMSNAYRSRYILIVDFDELIIPRKHRDFRELLLAVDSGRANSADRDRVDPGVHEPFEQYSVSNAYFFREFGSVVNETKESDSELFSLKYRKRATSDKIEVAPKSFLDPRTCLSVFNHYCYIKLESSTNNNVRRLSTNVPNDMAVVQHYRHCGFNPTECRDILSTHKVDDTALLFFDELRPRVRLALNTIRAS